jgi:transposase
MMTDIDSPGVTGDFEVITRGEWRRRWSLEEKQAIVAESLTPHASMMAIARKHGIGTGQLYGWRHQLLDNRTGGAATFRENRSAPTCCRS